MLYVEPIEAFDDNYIWLLRRTDSQCCAVVDPGDADSVVERLSREGLELRYILITHKHGDHVGGVRELKRHWPAAVVFGPIGEPIPLCDQKVQEGEQVQLPALETNFQVWDIPGHTEGHIAYLGAGLVFCGDTLFACGCGRVFSGTFEQLHNSLQRLAGLDPNTRVYCAHEYTLANIGFARWVEPENPALQARAQLAEQARSRGEPTVPSTIDLELKTNPFMRTAEAPVIAAAQRWADRRLDSGAAVFRAVRTWKDRDYD